MNTADRDPDSHPETSPARLRTAYPLVSIVTAVLNGEDHLDAAIRSIRAQQYPNIEHIIVDGGSRDQTPEIVKAHGDWIAKSIREPDKGIYDAMNKGIRMASGEIIGTLNADDFYPHPDVIAEVVRSFQATGADAVFADLLVVDRGNPEKVIRYYDSADFHPDRFARGWMPPHPTFFTLRRHYETFGLYRTDYRIAADYELLVRFLARHELTYARIPGVLVHMRAGGVSSRNFKSNWILNREIVRACRENGIHTSMPRLLCKYPRKLLEYFRRPAPVTAQ
ncbi:glycosyltransferase family 2 protein [Desulfonatronum parangueonense]